MNIGLPSVLGLIFIALKLAGEIAWSWWWVLSPFWIAAIIYGAVLWFAVKFLGARW